VAIDPSAVGPKELGLRFNLVSLLPTTALVLFVLALLASGAPTRAPDLGAIFPSIGELEGTQLAALTVFVLVLGLIAYPFQLPLVRLLEGYWSASSIGRSLGAIGVELNRRRLDRLGDDINGEGPIPSWVIRPGGQLLEGAERKWRETAYRSRLEELANEQFETYPDESLLLPTRLGNALRAAEAQAGQRYGLDTVTMFPRLYAHLSNRMEDVLADLRDQLDVAARLCAVLLMATAISTGLLATHGWWLLVPATTALLAWLAYRAAVRAAISYGEQIYVAFDLHRFDMLRGLHLPLPRNPREELEFNERLSEFFAELLPADKLDLESYQHGHGQLARAAEPHDPVRS
jgi:hypothetical protein